jgi:hypothetical protein
LSTPLDSAFTSVLIGRFRFTWIFLLLKSVRSASPTVFTSQDGRKDESRLTRIQIILILLLIDQHLRLDQQCQHLPQNLGREIGRPLQLRQGKRVAAVVLEEDCRLEESVLLVSDTNRIAEDGKE